MKDHQYNQDHLIQCLVPQVYMGQYIRCHGRPYQRTLEERHLAHRSRDWRKKNNGTYVDEGTGVWGLILGFLVPHIICFSRVYTLYVKSHIRRNISLGSIVYSTSIYPSKSCEIPQSNSTHGNNNSVAMEPSPGEPSVGITCRVAIVWRWVDVSGGWAAVGRWWVWASNGNGLRGKNNVGEKNGVSRGNGGLKCKIWKVKR